MKRGLELDCEVETPVASEFDDIDSPSKRNRSTPPPTQMGPVHVNAQGALAPSFMPPKFSAMAGIRRLLPAPVPVEAHIYGSYVKSDLETFLSSLVERVIFVFENVARPVPEYILEMPELQNVTVIVSDQVPSIAPHMISLHDPAGELAKECRVLDPVGGGAAAAPCIVYVRNRQVVSTAMLGGRADVVQRTIRGWVQSVQ